MNTNKQIVCHVCGELVDEDKYSRHIRNGHRDKREFRCDICAKEFTSNYNLQYHIAHHLNERNFVCNECPRAYNTAADLAQHQRIHEKQRDPYKCEHCNLFFEIRSKFNTHMRIHKTVKKGPKTCTICNKTVLDVKRHHETVHLQVRNHQCEVCFKKFNKRSGLERHFLTVHEKKKNFVCDICNAAFGEKSLMVRHTRRHSIVKTSFYCTLCKKYVGEIREHYEAVHANLPHGCEFCYRRFQKRREWKNHVMTRHSKVRKWLCDLCGKGFAQMYQLKRHFRTHINVDRITELDVEKLIKNLENSKHLKKSHREYKCKICYENFNEKHEKNVHMELFHRNEVKLKVSVICDHCGESFKKLLTLEKHLKDHIELKSQDFKEEMSDGEIFTTLNDQKNDDNFKSSLHNIKIESITIKKEPEFIEYDDNDGRHPFFDNFLHNDNFEIKIEEEELVETKFEENKINSLPDVIANDDAPDSIPEINCEVNFSSDQDDFEEYSTLHDSDNESSFECKECDENFDNKKSLFKHYEKDHKELKSSNSKEHLYPQLEQENDSNESHDGELKDQCMCSYCGKILMSERNLKLHILAIHKNHRFECTVCSKSFTYKSAMYRHRDREHGKGKIYKCDHCSQKVGTKHELALHNERHHNSMRESAKPEFMCTYCGICFPSAFVLSRHERRIHNTKSDYDEQRKCNICLEKFKVNYWKLKHMAQVHDNGKKIMRKCQLCSMEFKLYVDFKNHIESHVENFICIICGKPFNDSQALSVHKQTHRKIDGKLRKFICDHCGHRLFTKIQLQQHMLKHVSNFDIHYCDICGKGFKFASSLYTHRKYHGEGEFVCTYCGRKFARNSDLISHIRSHTNEKPFKCEICGKEFAQKQALYYHHQTHPETRAKANCTECNITFSDKKQLKIHEEQVHPEKRPFRCFICNMTFKQEHNLRRHNTDRHFKIQN